MEINAVVSENARRLREEKRLTLDEAARLTGVSRSMLAQIEKGDVNPTISMVWKIANGYKVSFTSLVEPARERPVLLRGNDAPILEEDGGRYRNCPAFPFDGERGFETYRIVMLPGGALEAQPHLPLSLIHISPTGLPIRSAIFSSSSRSTCVSIIQQHLLSSAPGTRTGCPPGSGAGSPRVCPGGAAPRRPPR